MDEDWLDEKWLLEESAALSLIETLNLEQGASFQIVSHSDRPDIVIEEQQTGQRIGVEVTHLFYDAEEARILLGRAKMTNHPPEYIEEYVKRLNALLKQKAEKVKGYNHQYPLALLIRIVSPVFHTHDFDAYADRIIVPPSDFIYIWLLFYDVFDHRWALLKRLR